MSRSTSTLLVALTIAVGAGASACKRGRELGTERNALFNAAIVDALHRSSIDNAIIRQQALYPYHFVVGSESLNDLGMRDALVLAAHYRESAGELSVVTGDASDDLLERRIGTVRQVLAAEGVEESRVRVVPDGMPGGPGISSTRLLQILEAAADPDAPALPEVTPVIPRTP